MLQMILPFLTADMSGLGRVNKQDFSQQALMELLVAEMPMDHYWGAFGDINGYHAVEHWSGLVFAPNKDVLHIEWRDFELEGTMRLEFLPFTVRCFEAPYNDIEGSLDTRSLPESLVELMLRSNRFSGTVDFAGFSAFMDIIILSANEFSGSVNLPGLPKQVTRLNIADNSFSGSLDLTALADGLRLLRCESNAFSGQIDLPRVPKGVEGIILSGNAFTQDELHIGKMGKRTKIDVSQNKIGAVFDAKGNKLGKRDKQIVVD